MISLTRKDGSRFVLNSDLIETVEATPDTVIRLTNQRNLLVRETTAQVVARVVRYRRRVARGLIPCGLRAKRC